MFGGPRGLRPCNGSRQGRAEFRCRSTPRGRRRVARPPELAAAVSYRELTVSLPCLRTPWKKRATPDGRHSQRASNTRLSLSHCAPFVTRLMFVVIRQLTDPAAGAGLHNGLPDRHLLAASTVQPCRRSAAHKSAAL